MMTSKDKVPASALDINHEEIVKDEKTDFKIHRHLADPDDQITEQDISNAVTAFGKENPEDLVLNDKQEDTCPDKNDTVQSKLSEENKDTREESRTIITPWIILGA